MDKTRLPSARGAVLTDDMIHELFPQVPLTGTEFELCIDDGRFSINMQGFYTPEEIHDKLENLRHCQGIYERFREISAEVDDRILDVFSADASELSYEAMKKLRWQFMRLWRFENPVEG